MQSLVYVLVHEYYGVRYNIPGIYKYILRSMQVIIIIEGWMNMDCMMFLEAAPWQLAVPMTEYGTLRGIAVAAKGIGLAKPRHGCHANPYGT